MAKQFSTLAPLAERWRENIPSKEIPIKNLSTEHSRCTDCILSISNSILHLIKKNESQNQQIPCVKGQQLNSTSNVVTLMPTISGSPVWLKDDEDLLFGYTIGSMLKEFPRSEKNRLKIHIFSFLATSQNHLNCKQKEYFV